jgi:putative flippase GtrA
MPRASRPATGRGRGAPGCPAARDPRGAAETAPSRPAGVRTARARSARLWRFAAVGASGLLVNTLALAALVDGAGLGYLVGAILATQGSSAWNFGLTELWVFGNRPLRGRRANRAARFLAVNNAALVARAPLLLLLASGLGVNYLVANGLSLAVLFLFRYSLAETWIWSRAAVTKPAYCYDIHGIVTVASEVRLAELERFMVDDRIADPTLRVQVGKPATRRERRNGNGVIHYSEALGRLGFAVDIHPGDRTGVRASTLLRHSPHVLYTNVVEPILRWAFVAKGYALVHGACISDGKRAYLITGRTDTGKTTTTLETLDRLPVSFLSDDLTVVCPDGRVLAYPKPLTVGRRAVRSLRAAQLSRAERVALVFQSRLHSRAGRRLGLALARLRMPAGTLNAVVQLLVPPPKYPVERLVPSARLAHEARLARVFAIERGGTGDVDLEGEEALDLLSINGDDAYGFPPYPAIGHRLRRLGGADLASSERRIVERALSAIPVTLLRSRTMDWSERIARRQS